MNIKNIEAPKKSITQSQLGRRILKRVSKSKLNTNFEFYNQTAEKLRNAKQNITPLTEEELEQKLTVKEFVEERLRRGDWKHETSTEGLMACAVTSTGFDAKLTDRKRGLTAKEIFQILFRRVKEVGLKTLVKFETDRGELCFGKLLFANVGVDLLDKGSFIREHTLPLVDNFIPINIPFELMYRIINISENSLTEIS